MKTIVLFFLFIFNLYANDLKNNQSIILASLASYSDAQTFVNDKLKNIKKPIYIIKSKRGFFIVSIGVYNTKEEVYAARDNLSENIKSMKPFRGNFNYDLTKTSKSILYRSSTEIVPIVVSNKSIIKEQALETAPLVFQIKQKNKYMNSISFGIGKTAKRKDVQRISVQRNYKEKISLNENLKLDGYFDFALTRFAFNEKDIYSFSITPIFKYNFSNIKDYTPYIFGGIGISYFSNTSADDKNISTHFQFEDRLGVGINKDNIDYQLSYFHNSNASIKEPNDGIDMILFNIMYSY